MTRVTGDNFRNFVEIDREAAVRTYKTACDELVEQSGHCFPIRKSRPTSTLLGHVVGSVIFSLGHYTLMIWFRKIAYFIVPSRYRKRLEFAVGDHIEFGTIGAYSLSSRTNFNGFYSDKVISFSDEKALPPVMKDTSLQSN